MCVGGVVFAHAAKEDEPGGGVSKLETRVCFSPISHLWCTLSTSPTVPRMIDLFLAAGLFILTAMWTPVSGTLHFELAAGKPGVQRAAESCLVLRACSYSYVPGSILDCLFFPFISNNYSCYTIGFYVSFLERIGIWIQKHSFQSILVIVLS